VGLGTDHVCVAVEHGEVLCRGDNAYGQLGLGDQRHRWGPTLVPGLRDIVQLIDTCALQSDGALLCWGPSSPPSIDGDASPFDCDPGEDVRPCSLQPRIVALGVSALADGPCIVQGRELRCWQAPEGTSERAYRWVVRASALPAVRKLAGTVDQGYVLGDDGRLWGWGDNRFRDQGRGFASADDYALATPIEGVERLVDLAPGSALTADGGVLVWGASRRHALAAPVLSSRAAAHRAPDRA
jgi:alpha-tubulin suppressor-like RCC1 family protein